MMDVDGKCRCLFLLFLLCVCDWPATQGNSLPDFSAIENLLKELKSTVADLRDQVSSLQSRVENNEAKLKKSNQNVENQSQNLKVRRVQAQMRTKRDTETNVSSASGSSILAPLPWNPLRCREGKQGRDGRDGRDGQPGPEGPPGKDGLSAQELEQVLEKVLDFKNADKRLPPVVRRNDSGAVYVRWGRTVCPESSQLIYEGFVAGSHYSHKGGGVNKLCLPSEPQFEQTRSGFQSGGHIYGAEFEVNVFNPFSSANTRGHSLHDSNAVCAVCLALSRPSHVMIPAKKDCPTGWTKEYNGYLMSSHYTQVKSSYDCVDVAPEVSDSGVGNQNGALFYIVESVCGGSLPCPPYRSGAELTCVVCTR